MGQEDHGPGYGSNLFPYLHHAGFWWTIKKKSNDHLRSLTIFSPLVKHIQLNPVPTDPLLTEFFSWQMLIFGPFNLFSFISYNGYNRIPPILWVCWNPLERDSTVIFKRRLKHHFYAKWNNIFHFVRKICQIVLCFLNVMKLLFLTSSVPNDIIRFIRSTEKFMLISEILVSYETWGNAL